MNILIKFKKFLFRKETLQETKERQKLRSRPNGVNVIGLALGKKITVEEEVAVVSLMIEFNLKFQVKRLLMSIFRKIRST